MKESIFRDLDVSANTKLFHANTDYLNVMREYNIKKVRVSENEIVGPALGMIRMIEEVYKVSKFQNVADLFAGALGYTQVCSKLGAQRIDAYDLYIENYYPENNKLCIHQADLLRTDGFAFSKHDLVIVEPPRKYHLLLLSTLPNILNDAVMLLRIGFPKYVDHIDDCRKICESKFKGKKWDFICLYDEMYIKIEC